MFQVNQLSSFHYIITQRDCKWSVSLIPRVLVYINNPKHMNRLQQLCSVHSCAAIAVLWMRVSVELTTGKMPPNCNNFTPCKRELLLHSIEKCLNLNGVQHTCSQRRTQSSQFSVFFLLLVVICVCLLNISLMCMRMLTILPIQLLIVLWLFVLRNLRE